MVDLNRFKTLIKREFRLDLFSYKEEQLHRRLLSYFARNEINNEDEYVKLLRSNSQERDKFMDFITINVTEFYRNPELFKELSSILNRNKTQRLRIWSAACSNGSEPYSLAILLNELGNTSSTILATDIDQNIISKAKLGEYDYSDIKNLPNYLISKHFTQCGDKYKVNDNIKRYVTFKKHDLLMDDYERDFDLIVCRNVVIYFNAEAKDSLYKKISNSLKSGGIFFVGATESIHNYNEFGFNKESSFIYTKK